MTVIQLKPEHFSNFPTTNQSYKFTGVPFTKVNNIKLDVEMPLEIFFKESFSDEHFHKSCILAHSTRKKSNNVVAKNTLAEQIHLDIKRQNQRFEKHDKIHCCR